MAKLRVARRMWWVTAVAWGIARPELYWAYVGTGQAVDPYRDVYSYEPITIYENAVYDYDHSRNDEGPVRSRRT